MISVRAGRISFTALSVAVTRFARRPFPFAGASPGQGADVAVDVGLETLDDVALVGEAAAEEIDQEGVRRVAGNRDCRIHRAASVVPWVGNGGGASLRDAHRRLASGQPLPLVGAGRTPGARHHRFL